MIHFGKSLSITTIVSIDLSQAFKHIVFTALDIVYLHVLRKVCLLQIELDQTGTAFKMKRGTAHIPPLSSFLQVSEPEFPQDSETGPRRQMHVIFK